MLTALIAFYDRLRYGFFNKRIAHIGKSGIAVKTRVVLHFNYAVFDKLTLVFVKFQPVGKIFVVALNELCSAKSRRYGYIACVILDYMSNCVNTAVHRAVRTEVYPLWQNAIFRNIYHFIRKLGNTLVLCGAYRDYGNAETLAEFFNVNRAAVRSYLVHHIERHDHRQVKLQKLQRQIKISLNIRSVNYVDYTVGLSVKYKIT